MLICQTMVMTCIYTLCIYLWKIVTIKFSSVIGYVVAFFLFIELSAVFLNRKKLLLRHMEYVAGALVGAAVLSLVFQALHVSTPVAMGILGSGVILFSVLELFTEVPKGAFYTWNDYRRERDEKKKQKKA